MICPECSTKVEEGKKFCGVCGAKIETARQCHNCGAELKDDSRFCGDCGADNSEANVMDDRRKYKNADRLIFPTKKKYPLLSAVLSLFWGGLGQIYLGQTMMGIVIMAIDIIAIFTTVGVGYFIIMIVSVIYAYKDAKTLQEGKPIHPWGMRVKYVNKEG